MLIHLCMGFFVGPGGAMDLVAAQNTKVVVTMEHVDKVRASQLNWM